MEYSASAIVQMASASCFSTGIKAAGNIGSAAVSADKRVRGRDRTVARSSHCRR